MCVTRFSLRSPISLHCPSLSVTHCIIKHSESQPLRGVNGHKNLRNRGTRCHLCRHQDVHSEMHPKKIITLNENLCSQETAMIVYSKNQSTSEVTTPEDGQLFVAARNFYWHARFKSELKLNNHMRVIVLLLFQR